ncbi:MAG: SMP-30/gluconolactonase/LRE family protein [Pirellula sp.]|jgi:gluconolactonase
MIVLQMAMTRIRLPHALLAIVTTVLLVSLGCEHRSHAQENKAAWVTLNEDAKVTLVADGFKFTEGPTVNSDGEVFFTDQPNDRIVKWGKDGKVVDFLKPAGRSNGMYFSANGLLVACADEANQMWEISSDGKHRVLFEGFEGRKLNGPNDVWIDSNGSMYFTDPYYQRPWWSHQKPPQAKQSVYKVDRDGSNIVCVDDALVQPNGIIGDSKKRILYVADIRDQRTYRYNIAADGSLLDRTVFCKQGSDGMTIDAAGNVYLTGSAGVYVYSEDGVLIQTIQVPKPWTANVCLGGKDRKTLFITASDSVYTIEVKHPGVGSK